MLTYSFKVWLTNVLVGPMLLISGAMGYMYLKHYYDHSAAAAVSRQQLDWPNLKEVSWMYLFGLMVTIPGFFLLWVGCFFICRRTWPVRMRKLGLAVCALLMIGATSVVLGMRLGWAWQPMTFLGGCYFLPLLCGIFFYRFPVPQDDPVFDF